MIGDAEKVEVDELVVLQKFDGDGTDPEKEIERLTIHNGNVVSHDRVESGVVVGPVPEEENLTGKSVGRLMTPEEAKEEI